MSQDPRVFEYDVALSFAGEDRQYADAVAGALKAAGARVFYDTDWEAELWGKDLYVHFDEVYRMKAKYCLMFLSIHYSRKLWTNHERKSAQARAFSENKEYILPVKLDDTEIPGVLPTTGYVDGRTHTPDVVARLALQKIERTSTIRAPSASYRLPKMPNYKFDAHQAALDLLGNIEQILDDRAVALRATGITVEQEARQPDDKRFRYVTPKGQEYHFAATIGDSSYGKDAIVFNDVVGRHFISVHVRSATAIGRVTWNIDRQCEIVDLINFSLLEGQRPSAQLTREELIERIWDKIVLTLERLSH